MSKLGQEPAFATSAGLSRNEDIFQGGRSKRFYAACAAMQAILSGTLSDEKMFTLYNKGASDNNEASLASYVAKQAYVIADELLKKEYE